MEAVRPGTARALALPMTTTIFHFTENMVVLFVFHFHTRGAEACTCDDTILFFVAHRLCAYSAAAGRGTDFTRSAATPPPATLLLGTIVPTLACCVACCVCA